MLEIVELVIGWRGGKGSPPSLGPFTLSVRPGEVIGLAGPSGCGKTMLLRCLGGESSSHGGELRWQGRSLTAAQRRDRRLVGYLGPAEPLAATGLDVRRTLELAARLLDQPRQRVNELLEQFALGECAASPLARLSSGLEERLRLALLELPRPSVVLLDRPLAQLDRAGNELLQLWLDRVRSRLACVLWAGPSAGPLARAADRAALIEPGQGITRVLVRGQDAGEGAAGFAGVLQG